VSFVLGSLLQATGAYKVYENRLNAQIRKGPIPGHIAIILDGNRRWAQNRKYSVEVGHAYGADVVENLLDWCHDLGIRSITLYALSTENLNRNPQEVQELLTLIEARLKKLLTDERIYRYRVKVKGIGKMEFLPEPLLATLREVEQKTAQFDGHYLNIGLAYGGRAEITDVVRSIAEDVKQGRIAPGEIKEETIASRLYTSYLPNPEPDMIIRTSGEERMSGFLLWQSAYSELIFLDVYLPAFRKIDLLRAVRTYQKRKRRFGK
jgi:tritrans,polycis-undecaprenyl-diphosphate synthase [geranylgeranyl-diphosphate specific]